MARIAGVDLPKEKRVEIGLTYVYGIGRKSANDILAKAGVNPDTRVKDLTDEEIKLLELTPEMSNKELREIIASLNAYSAPALEDSEAESEADSEAESEADSEEAATDREPKRLQLSWNAETDADGKKLIKAMQEAEAMHYDFVEVTVL